MVVSERVGEGLSINPVLVLVPIGFNIAVPERDTSWSDIKVR
jgi:hypothetical protein